MSDEQKKLLEQQLWAIANILRGKMDADDYRNYILGFIFFKYLSEKLEIYAKEILEPDNLKYTDLEEEKDKMYIDAVKKACIKKLGYFLKPSELFSSLANKGNNLVDNETNENDEATQFFILEDLERILNNIEQSTMGTESEDDFIRLFEDLDLNSSKLGKTTKAKNEIIAKILNALNKIDFQLEDTNADVLGDAYEYLIAQFAATAGKKAGEFYTPQSVSTILARIVTSRKRRIKSVYDPTCGSGSLLLRVAKEVDDVGYFYGQELNRTTYNLARMNMILHDVHYTKFDIKQEDTLENPQHENLKAEAIVANPPFSVEWSAKQIFMSDDRFSQYGRLAPKKKADLAFVQHMIHHLDENGIMACVLPHGVLYRGGSESIIRKYLIEDCNYLDAIIGLPSNIFFGTPMSTCIMVFKKCREANDDILFFDASSYSEKQKNQNVILKQNIEDIIDIIYNRTEIDKISRKVKLSEVKSNKYFLKLATYVNNNDDVENINLIDIYKSFDKVENETKIIDLKLKDYCDLLSINFPNGNNLYLLEQFKKAVAKLIFDNEVKFSNTNNDDFPEWEYKTLDDVLDYIQPTKYIVKSTDYNNSFETPVLTAGKTFVLGYTDETENIFNELPVIIFDDFTTASKYVDFPFKVKSSAMKILKPKSKEYNVKYIYEAMQQLRIASGDEHKRYWISEFSQLEIVLPSLEEQNMIADFLLTIDRKIELLKSNIVK